MTISVPMFTQDQVYPSWMLRRQLASERTAGVANPSTDLIVSAASGLQVSISSGTGYVQQNTVSQEGVADAGLYYVFNDGPVNPYNTVSAPLAYPRIDILVLRVYDIVEQASTGSSFARVEWVQGVETNGANLTNFAGMPSPPNNSLGLASVLQTPGETSIAPGNILNWSIDSLLVGGKQPGEKIESFSSSYVGALPAVGGTASRIINARMFAKIGTAFGTGDGATTFGLPDWRGRATVGSGQGTNLTNRTLGQTGGEETHQLSVGELAQHNHTLTDPGHAHTINDPGHGHVLNDPQHQHTFSGAYVAVTSTPGGFVGLQAVSGNGFAAPAAGANNQIGSYTATAGSPTGITMNGAYTGIGVNVGGTNISLANAGSNTAHNNMQPFGVASVFIKV